MIAIFGGGLPACHPAQPSPNSIEYFPDLRLMETDLFAAAIALEPHVAADPTRMSRDSRLRNMGSE